MHSYALANRWEVAHEVVASLTPTTANQIFRKIGVIESLVLGNISNGDAASPSTRKRANKKLSFR